GADLQVVQQQLAETGAALAQARSEARGLSSSLLIDTAQPELLPAQPTFRQRGAMALAGAALGFIAGVWLVQRGGRA
ncbi:MAG: hypothetical protein HY835_09625, partial [Anaerolineae bacterium]|nr:hypothetical protein [Anaerolineae bacterium]